MLETYKEFNSKIGEFPFSRSTLKPREKLVNGNVMYYGETAIDEDSKEQVSNEHGRGMTISLSGVLEMGTWENGQKHGIVRKYATPDTVEEWEWNHGQMNGRWVIYMKDGTVIDRLYKNNKREGESRYYGENG